MGISIVRDGDTFVLRFDLIGLDGVVSTSTFEIGWQEADEIQRLISQHLLDWHVERDPQGVVGDLLV
jgi:hypothetical protein